METAGEYVYTTAPAVFDAFFVMLYSCVYDNDIRSMFSHGLFV